MFPSFVLPFVTEADYAQWSGTARQVLFPEEQVTGGPPVVIPDPGPDFYNLTPLSYRFPAVTLTTLREVVVRGKSNMLTMPEAILRHGLIDLETDVTPDEMYSRLLMSEDRRTAEWAPSDRFNVGYLPEAAVFTDWTAFNYAHWLTEVLPRVAGFVQARGASVPFLVDSELHPNIVRSIHLVAGGDVVLHRLPPDHLVRIGVLHNVSPAGYVPFKLREQQPVETIPHGMFGGQGLRAMVEVLRAAAAPAEPGRPRLFLRRQSSMRHIVNEAEIAEALESKGFVTVRPEDLSLPEQIALYSRAKMIVGATGAAFANLIFCQPDCAAVVLMPKFRHTAYWYWRRMAAASGAGPVVHVSGEQIDPIADPFHPLALHRDFRVELKDVLEAVEAAEALVR
jgi:capsular polysaccharide biosynthesis protein